MYKINNKCFDFLFPPSTKTTPNQQKTKRNEWNKKENKMNQMETLHSKKAGEKATKGCIL